MGVSKHDPSGAERRQHPRIDQNIRIDFKLDADENTIPGETYNLSPVGVYCKVDRPIPEMTQLLIMLDLPTSPITCEGTVVRSEPDPQSSESHHLAIFFNKISDEATRRLTDFLDR